MTMTMTMSMTMNMTMNNIVFIYRFLKWLKFYYPHNCLKIIKKKVKIYIRKRLIIAPIISILKYP